MKKWNILAVLALVVLAGTAVAVTLPGTPSNTAVYVANSNEMIVVRGTFPDFKCKNNVADTIVITVEDGYVLDDVILMVRDSAYAGVGADSGRVKLTIEVLGLKGTYAPYDTSGQAVPGKMLLTSDFKPGESLLLSLPGVLPAGVMAWGYRIITSQDTKFLSTDSVKCRREYLIGKRLFK